jgi:CRP/FNR family transcriptional regulator, cyclic AMP receptor protein
MKGSPGTWRISAEIANEILNQADAGRRCRFKKNESLYEQGTISSKFYLILSGLVVVSIVRGDGTEVVLEFMGPQAVCGEGAAFDRLPRFSTAIAVEATDAIEFDASKMTDVFRAHPELATALLRVTGLKQRVLAIKLEHIAAREPEGRIMELLERLAGMFGVDHSKGRLLVTRITHEQIGSMTGTSRVTVTRTLQRLRERRIIDIHGGHIIIKSQLPQSKAP